MSILGNNEPISLNNTENTFGSSFNLLSSTPGNVTNIQISHLNSILQIKNQKVHRLES